MSQPEIRLNKEKTMCKNLMSVVLFLVLACFLAPINASPKSGLSNDQIKRRLTYLVGVKSFSTSQPLSQQRLMKLIVELASVQLGYIC